MKLKDRVALRIRTLRKQRKLTQEGLADRIQRTVDAISLLERGVSLPSFETLERLGVALEVPVRDFFDSDGADAKIDPHRAVLLAALQDTARALPDQELEIVLQLTRGLAARQKKPVVKKGRRIT